MLHVQNFYQNHKNPIKISSTLYGLHPPSTNKIQNWSKTSTPRSTFSNTSSPKHTKNVRSKYSDHVANSKLATIGLNRRNVKNWAVLDSGATGNFLVTDAPLSEKQETTQQLTVSLPDGNEIRSTHTGLINVPRLPRSRRIGHVIPGLSRYSLVSVVASCNAGCDVMFTKIDVIVKYRGRVVLTGRKCTRTGLWMVPLHDDNRTSTHSITNVSGTPPKTHTGHTQNSHTTNESFGGQRTSHQANALVPTSTKAELARCYHQCMGSPPKSALLRTLRNHPKELETFPGLNKKLITKYLPP